MGSYSIFHWLIVLAVIALIAAPIVLIVRWSSRRRQASDAAPRDKGPW